VSLLAGLYARELTVSVCPNPRLQVSTLTNSGDQVFSGTIAGSEPVMIHDSKFSFSANLRTGAEHGSVYLTDHIAGPQVRCQLGVVGTGKSASGNPTFKYAGTCAFGG
jgi:hypothetical protein